MIGLCVCFLPFKRYNLLPFTDTSIVICKIIVGGRTQFAPTKRLVGIRRGDLWSPVVGGRLPPLQARTNMIECRGGPL